MLAAETVVVGVDGSRAALHAVRWAAARAVPGAGRLRLVYAVDDPLLSYSRDTPMRERPEASLRTRGERVLAEGARAAADVLGPDGSPAGAGVELVERPGAAVPVLLTESRQADLLVLGTWGLTALGRALVGSTTIALAARADCPTAVVRGRTESATPPESGPVVAGVDLEDRAAGEVTARRGHDSDVLATAFAEASACGAALIVAHVWPHTVLQDALQDAVAERVGHRGPRERAAEVDERLARRLATWQQRYPDVEVERLVSRGQPADLLAGLGERARLLVVGSRGRGGLTGMLLGSTSQAVLMHAPCPVLVARPLRRERKDGET